MIKNWTTHRPFIPNVPSQSCNKSSSNPIHPHQKIYNHLVPFDTPMPKIIQSKTLRICMQNSQHLFNFNDNNIDILSIIDHLKNLDINIYSAISPNINWKKSRQLDQNQEIFLQNIPSGPFIGCFK
jgi:hypothetical protein